MATEARPRDGEPELIRIRPPRGWRLPDMRELWRFRELLWVLGVRDITIRYRQTMVGATWIIAGPVLSAGVFSFVFGRVADLDSSGIPYFAFSYAGLMAWSVFSGLIGKTSMSLVSNSAMIAKVYFPRLVLPFATVFGIITNFAVTLAMMGGIMVAYGLPFSIRLLLVPVLLILLVMLALGTGAVFAAGAVSFRDVGLFVPTLTGLLLYVSPVAYGTNTVPESLQTIYLMNPVASLLELWRWCFFGTGTFYTWSIVTSVLATVVLFVFGMMAFTRMEPRFPDVI